MNMAPAPELLIFMSVTNYHQYQDKQITIFEKMQGKCHYIFQF